MSDKLIDVSFLFDNLRDKEVVVQLSMTRNQLDGVYKLMEAYRKQVETMSEPNKPQLYFEACEKRRGDYDLVKRIEEVR